MTIEAYPLCWPEGWPRTPTHKRERSRFNVTPDRARKQLIDEIRRLVGHRFRRDDVILSTNIRLRNDGEPYTAQRQPEDAGVAVYFKYKDQSMVFACDRWKLVHDNMHAISKTIDALRGIERWSASDMLERAFTGFQALPFFDDNETWNSVLQVGNIGYFTFDECRRNYRTLAADYHPDKPGGSHEKMSKLNWALDQAKKHFGKS